MLKGRHSERALILAPLGRDATVAGRMLDEAGISSVAVPDLAALHRELEAGAGIALVTEEALLGADLRDIAAWIEAQPEWSDFPFVLLTHRGGGLERNPSAARFLKTLGNVTFVERPFHPTTLVSLAEAALRGRRRQYDARSRLELLRDNERQLRSLAEELERRVDERTREREQALAQLHEAQKIEAIGQLTGGVAHDFNNLLTPVMGNLELLRRRVGDDPKASRFIDSALQASDRAATLVQRLLAFARRQDLRPQPVDVAALVHSLHDLINRTIGPSIEVTVKTEDGLPAALIDPNQLELAILNLAINARDAMPDGGALEIELAAVGQRPPTLIGGPENYVCLSVTDTGTGMDEATLAHAIEPFFSTKEAGRGTGLGLSMVHGLVAQSGGAIKLDSELGTGTRIEMWLPRAAEPAAAQARPDEGLAFPDRPATILLVDDEELVREGTAELLDELGYEVVQASSGEDALEQLRVRPQIDLLLTDYLMPQMNGAELAAAAKAVKPSLPVLLITGFSNMDRGLGSELPRLSKPFRHADLAKQIAALLPHFRGSGQRGLRAGSSGR